MCATKQRWLGYRDKEDEEIFWEVRNVAHKGSREQSKDAATVDRRDAARCRNHFVEECLIPGGYLLGVEFAAEDCWFVGDAVTVD